MSLSETEHKYEVADDIKKRGPSSKTFCVIINDSRESEQALNLACDMKGEEDVLFVLHGVKLLKTIYSDHSVIEFLDENKALKERGEHFMKNIASICKGKKKIITPVLILTDVDLEEALLQSAESRHPDLLICGARHAKSSYFHTSICNYMVNHSRHTPVLVTKLVQPRSHDLLHWNSK